MNPARNKWGETLTAGLLVVLLLTLTVQGAQANAAENEVTKPDRASVVDSLRRHIELNRDKHKLQLEELMASRQSDQKSSEKESGSSLLDSASYFIDEHVGTEAFGYGYAEDEPNIEDYPDDAGATICAANLFDYVYIVGEMSTYSYGTVYVTAQSGPVNWTNPFKVLVSQFGTGGWVDITGGYGWATCEDSGWGEYDFYPSAPFLWVAIYTQKLFEDENMGCCMEIDAVGSVSQQAYTTHTLTIDFSTTYFEPATLIDDEYVGSGDLQIAAPAISHSMQFEEPIVYGYQYWWFSYSVYDSSTHYDNPSTISLSQDKTVTVYYYNQ